MKKPSEALRDGAKLTAQCRGRFISRDGTKACALGAMWIGMVGAENAAMRGARTPRPTALLAVCKLSGGIWEEIINRNDSLGQTREEIADWLEGIGL